MGRVWFLVAVLGVGFVLPLLSQTPKKQKVQLYADEIYNVKGTDTVVFHKNVVLHHNGAVVVCDSAVRYDASRFECFGRVIINQDSTYIYGQRATYDQNSNTASVYDPLIKVVSGSAVLYTYNFSFNTLEKLGRYWGGGTLTQGDNRLESDRGWYRTDTKDVYVAGAVQLSDTETKLTTDSLRYNMTREEAEFYTLTHVWGSDGKRLSATKGKYYHKTDAYDLTEDSYVLTREQEVWADSIFYAAQTRDAVLRRNIQMLDHEQQAMAFGDYGEYHGAAEDGFLTLEPSVVSFDPNAPADSMFVRADTILVYSLPWGADSVAADSVVIDSLPAPVIEHDSLQRIVRAWRNVKIWRRDFQAVCDSMVGFNRDSTMHMHIDPVIWHENNQITARLIDIFTRNRSAEKAHFTGDPLMVSQVDTGRYNQIKGREMTSFFRNNDVYRHRVTGNGQTLYYRSDHEGEPPNWFMNITSAGITFLVDSQQVTRITWDGNIDYTAYPIDQIPDDVEQRLPGFRWEIERRPERDGVFRRAIKPSRKENYTTLSPPQFPLTERIEAHKLQMIGAKIWEERYELLPQNALERLKELLSN